MAAVTNSRIFMPGYGVFEATGISHPISVRALAIVDPDTGSNMVLVAADVLALNRTLVNEVRVRVQTSRGLAPEQVLIQAIHTHTAPLARTWPIYMEPHQLPDAEFMQILTDSLAGAIEDAYDGKTEAVLTFGRGSSDIGYNRRPPPFEHEGDPTLDVLEVRTATDQPIATAFFFACHPVALGRSSEVSPDYPGVARDVVEANKGGTAIFFQAFGGSIDPVSRTPRGLELMTQLGNALANDVLAVLASPMQQLRAGLAASSTFIALPLVVDETLLAARTGQFAAVGLEVPTTLDTEVQTFRLETVEPGWRLVAISNEVVNEYSQPVRDIFAPEPNVTLAGYSNGSHSYLPYGYMTTKGDYEGYDAQVNNYVLPGPCTQDVDAILLTTVQSLRH